MTHNWMVIKFGGTSVSSLSNWQNIIGIIRGHLANSFRIVVVCSAITHISNKLDALIHSALTGQHQTVLLDIENIHKNLSQEFGLNFDELLSPHFNRLNQLAEGISLVAEASPRIRAQVMAFGELMLTVLAAAFLRNQQLPVDWQDARDLLIAVEDPSAHSGAAYLMARCSADYDENLLTKLNSLSPVVVTQGFIASNHHRETVLFGRGGSDTSAAYFAAKINAKRCEIWTDVPGIYTADPRQIPEARLLRKLDYDEAQEIASMGGKVLHPNSIPPVKQQSIPLWVKCTSLPDREGTEISLIDATTTMQIKAILCKYGVLLISIETVRMWHQVGFLANIFNCFKKRGLSVDLVSTSESNVTVSLDNSATSGNMDLINLLLNDLNDFGKANLIGPCSTLSLIGHNIRSNLYKLGEVFQVFEQQQIHMLSQAANDLNLTFVVDEDQAERLAQKIHNLLIENNHDDFFSRSWLEEFGHIPAPSTKVIPWWVTRREQLLNLIHQRGQALYVYDAQCLRHQAQHLLDCQAIDRIYYAMKANGNADILKQFHQLGINFECVSIFEVNFVLDLFPDIERTRILFTPNFAQREEYAQAMSLNIVVTLDSLYPLQFWPDVFAGKPVFLRFDPGQGYGHHHYVCTGGSDSKFGIPLSELNLLINLIHQHHIVVAGLHAHVGSGILREKTWQENFIVLSQLLDHFPDVKVINVGGGLGVTENPSQHPLNLQVVNHSLLQAKAAFPDLKIWMEPGRYLVAEAGVILARVTQVKDKNGVMFVGIETGMNSLIRPALYGSFHEIVNLTRLDQKTSLTAHIVGPICESGDVLGYSRILPETREGDVLLIANTGAYGYVMGSHYNMRAPATECWMNF